MCMQVQRSTVSTDKELPMQAHGIYSSLTLKHEHFEELASVHLWVFSRVT